MRTVFFIFKVIVSVIRVILYTVSKGLELEVQNLDLHPEVSGLTDKLQGVVFSL